MDGIKCRNDALWFDVRKLANLQKEQIYKEKAAVVLIKSKHFMFSTQSTTTAPLTASAEDISFSLSAPTVKQYSWKIYRPEVTQY